MRQNSSGSYADGSLRRRFHVSVRHHPPASDVILRLSPLSRYDRTRLDADPVVVHWRVGGGHDGQFTLIENGAEQQFVIPVCRSALAFVHVNCWSEYGGTAVPADDRLPGRRIIGYLHAIDSSPAAGFGGAQPPSNRSAFTHTFF